MNHQKDLQKIIERYVSGKATSEEIKFVEKYYQYLDKADNVLDKDTKERMQMEEESLNHLLSAIRQPVKAHSLWIRYAAAAVIISILGFSILYFSQKGGVKEEQKQVATTRTIDVLPGMDRAILTLADGSKVVLDDTKDGKIIQTANLSITKTKSGQLIYQATGIATNPDRMAYHTIETPKGGQYQIYLPDGTKVWLNAASSLKYPERFHTKERKVTLTGEAYFEVAKDKSHPFIVHTEGNGKLAQDVEVLGTHFNVNAYMDDQSTKTTLVEGSVKVSSLASKKSNLLTPGQQSVLSDHSFLVKSIDTGDDTAWKDGLFRFNNANLKNILYQLERWYDIKIDYRNIPHKRYNGMVPRKAKLSEVLHMLELTGNIDFKIDEGRQLSVLTK
ncbi:MAG: FecR family protein [Bacteroidia bacterium]